MSTDGMIAFLPMDGSFVQQDFPHMTLVHLGSIEDRPEEEFNQMAKDAIAASRVTGAFSLSATGVEQLGPDNVDALILYPTPQLLQARKMVQQWDTGEFPVYKPHVTIGPEGSASNPDPFAPGIRMQGLPTRVFFNRIAACWGDKRLIFNIENF